jgi:hypothetical protein
MAKKGQGSGLKYVRTIGESRAERLMRPKDPNLAGEYPEIAAQWGINGTLTASHVTFGSGLQVNWICTKCQQSWRSRIQTRTASGIRAGGTSDCPYCRGVRVSDTNSIAYLHKEAAQEFDISNNDGRRPEEIVATHKKTRFNFRCLKNVAHGPYRRTPYARTVLNKGCPRCFEDEARLANRPNSLAVKEPFVAMQWKAEKNALTTYDVTPQSNRRAYFECEHGHEKCLRVCDKVRRPDCAECMSTVGREMTAAHNRPVWRAKKTKGQKPKR